MRIKNDGSTILVLGPRLLGVVLVMAVVQLTKNSTVRLRTGEHFIQLLFCCCGHDCYNGVEFGPMGTARTSYFGFFAFQHQCGSDWTIDLLTGLIFRLLYACYWTWRVSELYNERFGLWGFACWLSVRAFFSPVKLNVKLRWYAFGLLVAWSFRVDGILVFVILLVGIEGWWILLKRIRMKHMLDKGWGMKVFRGVMCL